MNEKVSVIIPVYNCERFVRETVESALRQTHPCHEVIVVDDGSTDKTADILKEYAGSGRIKYIYQENSGVCSARNTAIRNSSGDYIALLDHDDIWHEDKIERQLAYLRANPDAGLVFCDEFRLYQDGSLVKTPPKLREGEDIFEKFFSYCYATPSTVMLKREVVDSVGLFNERLRHMEDREFMLRAGLRFRMAYMPEYLLTRRYYPESYSAINATMYYSLNDISRSLKGVLDKRQTALLKLQHNNKCWKHVSSLIDRGDFRGSVGLFLRIARHHPPFLARMPQLLRKGVQSFIRRRFLGPVSMLEGKMLDE